MAGRFVSMAYVAMSTLDPLWTPDTLSLIRQKAMCLPICATPGPTVSIPSRRRLEPFVN